MRKIKVRLPGISEHDRLSVNLASKYYRSMVMDMGFPENDVPFVIGCLYQANR